MSHAEQLIDRAVFAGTRSLWSDDERTHAQSHAATSRPTTGVNVGSAERIVSAGVGLLLAALAAKKPLSVRSAVLAAVGGGMLYRSASGHCSLYSALGISTKSRSNDEPSAAAETYHQRGVQVRHALTIEKPAEELYAFWRNFQNLPQIMKHLKDVKVIDDKRSSWVAKAPLGLSVKWDAEIINDEKNQLIAWRSVGNADIDNSGSVRFVPNSTGGTEVHVTIDYIPPAGKIGSLVAMLFGKEPEQQIVSDLRGFKQMMEAGEVATNNNGEPRGNGRA